MCGAENVVPEIAVFVALIDQFYGFMVNTRRALVLELTGPMSTSEFNPGDPLFEELQIKNIR